MALKEGLVGAKGEARRGEKKMLMVVGVGNGVLFAYEHLDF